MSGYFKLSWCDVCQRVSRWTGSIVTLLGLGGELYSAEEFRSLIDRESDRIELKTGTGGKPLQEVLVAFSMLVSTSFVARGGPDTAIAEAGAKPRPAIATALSLKCSGRQ